MQVCLFLYELWANSLGVCVAYIAASAPNKLLHICVEIAEVTSIGPMKICLSSKKLMAWRALNCDLSPACEANRIAIQIRMSAPLRIIHICNNQIIGHLG